MKELLYRVIPRGNIAKSVLILSSGTAIAQMITAVSMPIVTRLYTPEMIGVISIYLSFFSFWMTLISWRYESALLIAKDELESHHIFRLGAILVAVTALLAIPTLGLLQYFKVLGFDVLPSWSSLVVSISSIGFGWFMLYRSWLLRLGETKTISIASIGRAGSHASFRVFAGALNFGVIGLFIAEIIGTWSALGVVRRNIKNLLVEEIPRWSVTSIKIVAIRYRNYVYFELPSSLINQLAIVLPIPLVGGLYGAQAAGWFGLARLLYAIPNGQIGKSVADVFQMELGKAVREKNYKRGEKLFYKFSVRLALFGLIPLVFAVVIAPPTVPYIFGEQWTEMGVIVAHIAPWMYSALIVGSMSRALSVLEKQHWKLLYDVSALCIVLISYLYTKNIQGNLIWFIDLLSIGLSLNYFIYFVLISWLFRSASR